jgi:hypothetical protein
MARRILRFVVLLLFGGAGLAIFRKAGGRRGPRAEGRTPERRATATAPRPSLKRRGPRLKLPVRRVLWITAILLLAGSVTFALFTKTTVNSGNTYASAADFRAPTIDRAVIQPNGGNNASAGYVKQGQSYFVYANVTDTGNPASGIATVTANVCNVTSTSCSAVALISGSFTVNSVTYNYRSAAQTASNPLSEGSKSYSITAADVAANSGNTSFNVTVDNTGPSIPSKIACGSTQCTTTGYVGAGASYYVYAQVSDSASGINTVTTDPRNITASASATTAMSTAGGPWTVGGTSYNYRSIQLTADAGLTNGNSFNYTVTANDNLSNATTPTGSATADNTAPTVGTVTLDKGFGRFPNYIRSSGNYYLYTEPSDAASGVNTGSTTANVDIDASNTLTTGRTNVVMCYSAAGYALPDYHSNSSTTYHYKSDSDGVCDGSFTALTTDASLPNGTRNWNVTVTDNAGNSATASQTANLNSTQNTAVDVKIKNNSGGTVGKLELNDLVIYNFSDSTDPESVLSGWSGNGGDGTGNVVVRLTDGGGTCVASSDQLQVYNATNTTPTNLGTVCLGGTGYNATGSTITFGATGTPSTIEAGLTNPISVTLGTSSNAACTATCDQATDTTTSWPPTSSLYDLAGNTGLTTAASNSIDNTAPILTRAQIQRTANNNPGFFKQGDSYYVYAELSDANSGIDANSITADVAVSGNVVSTGKTSVKMCSNGGPFTVGGQSYTYRSDDDGVCGGTGTALTSDAAITDGSKTYNVTFKDNAANSTTGTPTVTEDSTAPTVSSSTISKSTGYLAGKVKSSVAYYPYANVSDAGVGISTVTANVSNITAGQTALAMTSGSYSTQGVSYNYRPASTVTSGTLTNGNTYTWTLTPSDLLGNTATPSGTSATGDTVAPDASDIQCTNVGTAGRPNNGDICNFTHTENIDPFSVNPIASWTGTSTTVAVRFLDAGTGSSPVACDTGTNDTMVIYNAANTAQITAMGCVNLGGIDYVTANGTCTASTLIQPSVPGTVNRVTLGGCPTLVTGTGTTTLGYYPSTSLYDAAGVNLTDATVQNETGTADRDF